MDCVFEFACSVRPKMFFVWADQQTERWGVAPRWTTISKKSNHESGPCILPRFVVRTSRTSCSSGAIPNDRLATPAVLRTTWFSPGEHRVFCGTNSVQEPYFVNGCPVRTARAKLIRHGMDCHQHLYYLPGGSSNPLLLRALNRRRGAPFLRSSRIQTAFVPEMAILGPTARDLIFPARMLTKFAFGVLAPVVLLDTMRDLTTHNCRGRSATRDSKRGYQSPKP